MSEHEIEDHDRGLSHDLPMLLEQRSIERRSLFGIVGGIAAAGALAACGSDSEPAASGTTTGTSPTPSATASTDSLPASGEIPEETAGPFPGDGSNGQNVLDQSGVVRSDIRSSFNGPTGVAEGVPLTIRMRIYDLTGTDTQILSGAAVYAWHCDREGRYSMYSEPIADENYLRGVQVADQDGWVSFTSVFPGAYDGRWPHVHFEVYPSETDATSASNRLRTSQLAFPQDVCEQVYAAPGYEQSVTNLARTSLDGDTVFSDGYSLQMATMTGDNDQGWTATLNVPV